MTQISYQQATETLKDERILLVGGAGFIGHNLALELRKLGAEVMIVDNMVVNNLIANTYDAEREDKQRRVYQNFLEDRFKMMREAGIQLCNGDARIMTDITQYFEEFKPGRVVHMSAISSAVDARINPGLCFDLQLTTLRNVLELCRSQHQTVAQLMLMSSSTVYGDFETPTVDETARPKPRGIYANAKYMAERLVRTYHDQYGQTTCIIRPSALYGERCISRRVSQVFIENALTGKPLRLEGGGDGRLDFTYINDLVEGMVRALGLCTQPESSYTFNLTYGNARTIAELAKIVKSVVPSVEIEIAPRAVDKPIRGTLSTDRARDVLGFVPSYSLDVGYKQYCEWYASEWERVSRANT
jgi:nucleoside-diphosphate-sugar epimerase